MLFSETQGATANILDPDIDAGGGKGNFSPAANGGDGGGPGYIDYTTEAKYVSGTSTTVGLGNPPCSTTTTGYLLTPVHTGGSDFCFADGHVKWLRGTQVSPGGNAGQATDLQSNGCGVAAGTAATTGSFAGTFSIN